MKGKTLFITALMVLAVGIVLCLTHNDIKSSGVVICGGILFIFAGLLNILNVVEYKSQSSSGNSVAYVKQKTTFSKALGWLMTVACVVLGLVMLVFTPTFIKLVPLTFGLLVACCALLQFYILIWGVRPVVLTPWLYFVPVVILGLAIYVFTLEAGTQDALIMLLTGIALSVFGVGTIAEAIMIASKRRKNLKAGKEAAANKTESPEKHEIQDSKYTEVKSQDIKPLD